MHVCQEVAGYAPIFRSVPLRDYFSLRAPSGPLMHPSGAYGYPNRVPIEKKNIKSCGGRGWVEAGADIAAHSLLDPEVYGQSYPHIFFLFFF